MQLQIRRLLHSDKKIQLHNILENSFCWEGPFNFNFIWKFQHVNVAGFPA